MVGALRSDDSANQGGQAALFVRTGIEWARTTFVSSDVRGGDFFGFGVAVDGDQILVGAFGEDGIAGTSLGGSAVGAVYAFSTAGEPPIDDDDDDGVDDSVPVWGAGGSLSVVVPAVGGESSLELSWVDDSSDDVGVVGFSLLVSTDGGVTFTAVDPGPVGLGTSFVVSGLSAETAYVFRVEAEDAAGNVSVDGPVSLAVSTSGGDVSVPTWVGGVVSGSDVTSSSVALSWSGATDDLGVVGYRVFVAPVGGTEFEVDPGPVGLGTSFVVSGLSSATEYVFRVEAEDAAGCLLYTSPSPRDRTRSRMPSSA